MLAGKARITCLDTEGGNGIGDVLKETSGTSQLGTHTQSKDSERMAVNSS